MSVYSKRFPEENSKTVWSTLEWIYRMFASFKQYDLLAKLHHPSTTGLLITNQCPSTSNVPVCHVYCSLFKLSHTFTAKSWWLSQSALSCVPPSALLDLDFRIGLCLFWIHSVFTKRWGYCIAVCAVGLERTHVRVRMHFAESRMSHTFM